MADNNDTSIQQMTAAAPKLTQPRRRLLRSGLMSRLVSTVKQKPIKVPLSTCMALSCLAFSLTANLRETMLPYRYRTFSAVVVEGVSPPLHLSLEEVLGPVPSLPVDAGHLQPALHKEHGPEVFKV